jgi:chloride channel 3/4/5
MANRNPMTTGAYEEEASSSSSRSPNTVPAPPHQPDRRADNDVDDDDDDLDLFGPNDGDEHDGVWGDDPLDQPKSFKRKQKQSVLSQPSRLLSTITGSRLGAPPPRSPGVRSGGSLTPTPLQGLHTPTRVSGANKDGAPLDWYVEGPGRRVGYEDLTAIDWIFEYTKERQRLRVLYSNATGLIGYVQQLLDASQVWFILVFTGLAVGALAAAIDVASDWLGDLKAGYCSSGPDGGAFYLNRGFCCLGYDQEAKCVGWMPWAAALGILSAGGKWFIEYLFFTIFSVTTALAAGLLVKEYAFYAKHSGIPEIKTVLGGFVIRRFLGGWTLLTKSLGLVYIPLA